MKDGNKPKRAVTFQGYATMRLTLNTDHYSKDEIDRCWYSSEEKDFIRDSVQKAIGLIKINPDREDDEQFCRRGLETLTGKGKLMKASARFTSREVVLFEQKATKMVANSKEEKKKSRKKKNKKDVQEKQMMEQDEQSLAEQYAKYCSQSRSVAYLLGLLDSQVARSIYEASDEMKQYACCGVGAAVVTDAGQEEQGSGGSSEESEFNGEDEALVSGTNHGGSGCTSRNAMRTVAPNDQNNKMEGVVQAKDKQAMEDKKLEEKAATGSSASPPRPPTRVASPSMTVLKSRRRVPRREVKRSTSTDLIPTCLRQ